MIIKLNGNPLAPVTTHGIDIKYDLKDVAADAYHVIHTPVNVDLSFAGHNIIRGDVNSFNWAASAIKSGFHVADHIIGSIF